MLGDRRDVVFVKFCEPSCCLGGVGHDLRRLAALVFVWAKSLFEHALLLNHFSVSLIFHVVELGCAWLGGSGWRAGRGLIDGDRDLKQWLGQGCRR